MFVLMVTSKNGTVKYYGPFGTEKSAQWYSNNNAQAYNRPCIVIELFNSGDCMDVNK